MGLDETERDESSVYLRCWGDFSTYTVQLTEGPAPALGRIGWRTEGPEALERAVARLEQAGVGEGWSEGQRGHGPAYRYRGPGGHVQELFWEVDRYAAPSDKRSAFPARPQRHSPRGAAPRQLDHITINTRRPYEDSEWYRDTLGYRFMEYTAVDENPDLIVFSMVTSNEKSHDLGLVIDFTEVPGRLNHLAFWVDTVEDVLRAADVLMEAGAHIEFGPGRHGMGEQTYLYFREPGGIRLRSTRRLSQLSARLAAGEVGPVGRGRHDVPQRQHAGLDDGGVPTRGAVPTARTGGGEPVAGGGSALMAAVEKVPDRRRRTRRAVRRHRVLSYGNVASTSRSRRSTKRFVPWGPG